MARNYISKEKGKQLSSSYEIKSSKYPTEKLIKNTYIHTGIYNFTKVAKQQERALPIKEMRDKMLQKFNEEIAKSQTRENEIYNLRKVNGYQELQNSLSLGTLGQKVWDNLNLYTLIDELIAQVTKEGATYTKSNEVAISADKFNQTLQSLFNEKIEYLKKDYDSIYAPLFEDFKTNNFVKTKTKEDVYLETLKEHPLAYFSTLPNYQGFVGEFSTLLDTIAYTNINEDKIITELFKKSGGYENIKIAVPQGKSDISVNSIGLSVKNYKKNEQENYNVSIHSGKSLKETFLNDFSEITNQTNFDLGEVLKSNNYNWSILNYFSYMFANLYTFKTIGGYPTVKSRQSEGNNFIKKDLFSNYSFINDFLKYSTIYWIGEKLLNSYTKVGQNSNPVAFLVLNQKMIPISKILISIRDDLGSVSSELTFINPVSFSPNVLRREKYNVIKQFRKNNQFKTGRNYPDPLLKIGASRGNSIINSVKFGMRLKIDYNAF